MRARRFRPRRQATPSPDVEALAGHARMPVELGYVPTARQEIFHRCPARYPLFGGAAGPGKSEATMYEHVMLCLEHAGWESILLRRTYPELEQSLIKRFLHKIPDRFYSWNGTEKIATFNNDVAGVPNSTLRFGHAQNETDIHRYKGDEYGSVGFDELTTFTLYQWVYMSTRNRTKIPGTFAKMTAASNPEGVGLEWVKALWIDREPAAGMDAYQAQQYVKNRDEYAFIPAKLSDNPHMAANDPDYARRMENLPYHLRRALLDGDWNVTAGTFFDCFDTARNTCSPRALFGDEAIYKIEPWTPRWIAIDWGFKHHCAIYFFAFVPPRFITYREMVVSLQTPEKIGHLIGNSVRAAQEPIDRIYLSPDAYSETRSEHTIAIEMENAMRHYGLPRPTKADNDRIGGAMLMYQLIQSGQWVISEECPQLIKAIKTRQRDPDPARAEDVMKVHESIFDNCYDSARYGLKTRVREPRKPLHLLIEERVTSSNPTIAMAQRARAEAELKNSILLPFRAPGRLWT